MSPISLSESKPVSHTKVKLYRYIETDCGPAYVWSTTGWLVKGDVYNVKWNESINKNNSSPTHWLPL